MKKQILLSIFLILFSAFVSARAVQAEENPIVEESSIAEESSVVEESPIEVVVEEEDIKDLTVDPSQEPPADQIMPPPAPTPSLSEGIDGDERSWTKFTYSNIIAEVSKRYDIDPQVIYATIMTESEGNIYAFRYEPYIKDASLGLGQVLISTARSLGFQGDPKELYKPEVSIDLIGRYHRAMLDAYGELTPLQLATAYNAGSPYNRPVAGHLFRFSMWYNEEG